MNITDGLEPLIELPYIFEIRKKYKVMIFASLILFFIDITDFTAQHKPNRRPAGYWNTFIAAVCNIGPEAKQTRFSGFQLILDL
ncbi:hypothetical protein JCM12296A_03080 [Desulfosarcina cetonica]